ncbi:MAG: SDR family NAD(P)-dependent oxidoreductase [Treponema sp.]|nr:SDR family NAD(P)-dependent oxidoreductase [Candidatus Treponema equifaecale]
MEKTVEPKVVLITGASSGIGLDAAIRFCKMGYKVYGAARRIDMFKQIEGLGGHRIFLDLTQDESIQRCVSHVLAQEGRIDILVNNAGYGLGGPLETISIEEAKKQFEVNLFGLARITQLVLPSMRQNKYGRIINVSSIAGKFSSPFLGWYHATKYSVEAYSDALRMEVAPFGIKVSIIEPGMIQTDWGTIAEQNVKKFSENSPYEDNGKRVSKYYHLNYVEKKASDPSIVGDAIIKAGTSRRPKIRYKIGKYARLFTFITKHSCDCFTDFVIRKVYGIK